MNIMSWETAAEIHNTWSVVDQTKQLLGPVEPSAAEKTSTYTNLSVVANEAEEELR